MKTLGPTFADELKAAGLSGLPIVWGGDDASISGRTGLTLLQSAALDAVIAAHDPTRPPAPAAVELWKARVVMKATPWPGTYGGPDKTVFDAVEAAIAAIADPVQKAAASEALEYASTFTRSGNLVQMLSQAIDMSQNELDALFIQAASIQS